MQIQADFEQTHSTFDLYSTNCLFTSTDQLENIFIKCKSCERMRVKSKFTQDWTLIKLAGHEPPRGCGYVVRSIRIVCANISCFESSYQCLFVACVII